MFESEKMWYLGFILAGGFFLGFSFVYPWLTLDHPTISDLLFYDPLLKFWALLTLFIGFFGFQKGSPPQE